MRATVDPDLCTSCEDCVNAVPEVFEMGEEGVAVTKPGDVPAELEADTRKAADDCPAAAIEIEE